MSTSNVALPVCRVTLYPGTHTDENPQSPLFGFDNMPANFQEDERKPNAEYFAARNMDFQPSYRIRLDLPSNGKLPAIGDKVFISRFTNGVTQYVGNWVIWDDPQVGTGKLPTMRLYIVRPIE